MSTIASACSHGRSTANNIGGGGIIGGELNNSLTLNAVRVSNNQDVPLGSLGGGRVLVTDATDWFAELDRERQTRLAARLLGPDTRQVFVTSPRADELPPNLELPVWTVENGRVASRE